MAEINGAAVLLKVGGNTVGSQTNVTFNENLDALDVSSKDSRSRKLIGGRYSATVTLDAMFVPDDTALATLKTAIRSDGAVEIVRYYGADFEEADAIVTSINEGFPDQAPATLSVTLEITGDWSAA